MLKILHIEDDPEVSEIMTIVLQDRATLVHAQNGQIGIDTFNRDKNFDLVICDFQMPLKNGVEVVKHIRAVSNVPIVAHSSMDACNQLMVRTGANTAVNKHSDVGEWVRILADLEL